MPGETAQLCPNSHTPIKTKARKVMMEAPVANVMPEIPLSVTEAANRGEKLKEPVIMAPREALIRLQEENMSRKDRPIDAEKLKSKWNRRKGKR